MVHILKNVCPSGLSVNMKGLLFLSNHDRNSAGVKIGLDVNILKGCNIMLWPVVFDLEPDQVKLFLIVFRKVIYHKSGRSMNLFNFVSESLGIGIP